MSEDNKIKLHMRLKMFYTRLQRKIQILTFSLTNIG